MSKRNKTILSMAFGGIVLLIFVLVYIKFIHSNYTINNKDDIENYLTAKKQIKTSPKKAYELSVKMLMQAEKSGCTQKIIDFKILVGQALSLQGSNKEALVHFNQVLGIAKKTNNTYGICSASMEIGKIYYVWGNYDTAFYYFKNALNISDLNNYTDVKAAAYNYIGKYYHTTGNFSRSINFYEKSVELYQLLGDTIEYSGVLLSIGKTFINRGDLHNALKCYLEAFKSTEKNSSFIDHASICNHLGTIYLALGQTEKSLAYHHKALNYREWLGNPEGMAKSYNNLGETYLSISKIDSAEFYFKKSIEYCIQTGYKKGTVKSLTNLGVVNEAKKQYKLAKRYLLESLKIAREIGYDAGVAESSMALGNTLYAEGDYKKAIFLFEESLVNANSSNLTEFLPEIYNGLYKCYSTLKDIEKSLYYHILFSNAEIKLLRAENDKQLAELRITFDSEKKEKDNEVLRKENELKEMAIQRKNAFIWFVIAAFMLTVVLCLLIYTRFTHKRKANRNLEVLNKKITEQNKELEILNIELEQANLEKDKILSIIAHELRNPLYWFQNLAEVLSKRYHSLSPEKIQKSLSALDESAKNAFHLMDNLLHWSRSRLNRITPKYGTHSLEILLNECTRMYDTILKHKEICLFTDIPREAKIYVDPDLFLVVVRNLVSNAIKYTPVKGIIDINCIENSNEYIISICDSGIGIPVDNLEALFDQGYQISSPGLLQERGSGFGLKLCKEFVELNKGAIMVNSESGKGAQFAFTVPKN